MPGGFQAVNLQELVTMPEESQAVKHSQDEVANDDKLVKVFENGKTSEVVALLKTYGEPKQIAKALYDARERLSPEQLGERLGRGEEFWQEILMHYSSNFHFQSCSFTTALRQFLWSFRLPGESQKIDRFMQSFASSFYAAHAQQTDLSRATFTNCDGETVNRRPSSSVLAHAWGWYVGSVEDAAEATCCAVCGTSEGSGMTLHTCLGCDGVIFCRKCMRFASRYGHAYVGRIGYGRACLATRRLHGTLERGDEFTYLADGKQALAAHPIGNSLLALADSWDEQRGLPFVDEDAAYVFAFSVMMLTTNLHNPNVKEKMTKSQFASTNRGINGGKNLPLDFMCVVYDDIKREEMKVRE
jgi:hypothetical protein